MNTHRKLRKAECLAVGLAALFMVAGCENDSDSGGGGISLSPFLRQVLPMPTS